MKHVVAALLLVTMAGAPVTTVACVGWCFPTEAQASTACHHAFAMLGIKSADQNCDRVLAISPFGKEETQLIVQAVLPASAPPGFLMSAPGEARLAFGHDVDAAVVYRSTSPLVLRL
jgi:hypothetical protein